MSEIPKNQIPKHKKISQFIIILTAIFCCNFAFAQFDIPEKPSFQTSVYDYANVLNASEKSQLEEKLIRYSDSTTTQIVVVTIESLKNESIGILTPKWAQTWGIGDKDKDNGVLILLAKNERKIWISAGYGLEDRLTAGIGGEIVRNTIIPEFKAGSYYNGLDKGADEIFKVFKGKYQGKRQESKGKDFPVGLIFLIFIVVIFIISRKNNNGGGFGGGSPSLLDVIILSNLGRSSGGSFGGGSFGGSSGGGGFGGGFGGGGFSGGGSGGDW